MKKTNRNFYNKVEEIESILCNELKFVDEDDSNFFPDLILVIDFQKDKIKSVEERSVLELGYIFKQSDDALAAAYEKVLKRILAQTEQQPSKPKKYNSNCHFEKVEQENYKHLNYRYVTDFEYQTGKKKTVATLSTLYINTVLYIVQTKCGFLTRRYLLDNKIFILIGLTNENLIKGALTCSMKKQINYYEIDCHVYEPVDNKLRPLKFHSNKIVKEAYRKTYQNIATAIKQIERKIAGRRKTIKKASSVAESQEAKQEQPDSEAQEEKKREAERFIKQVHRKFDLPIEHSPISDEAKLNSDQIQKYLKYLGRYQNYAIKIYETYRKEQFQLTQNESAYVRSLVKPNKRTQDIFKKSRLKGQHFQLTKQLGQNFNYEPIPTEKAYVEFFTMNKHKRFADRMKNMFVFKPNVVGPNDEFQLFFKMQRTRIAYLAMMNFCRIEKLKTMGIELFTLHNKFEKSGIKDELSYIDDTNHNEQVKLFSKIISTKQFNNLGEIAKKINNSEVPITSMVKVEEIGTDKKGDQELINSGSDLTSNREKKRQQTMGNQELQLDLRLQTAKGGLDGKNLQYYWPRFTFWNTDLKVVRDYMGERIAYYVHIQNHLNFYLLGLVPFAIGCFIVQFQSSNWSTSFNFFFTIFYNIIFVFWFLALLLSWQKKEQIFLSIYAEKQQIKLLVDGYESPYIRNLINENPNDYEQGFDLRSFILQHIYMVIVFTMVAIELVVFQQLRGYTMSFNQVLNIASPFSFTWAQLVIYAIFYIGNQVIYRFILQPLLDIFSQHQRIGDENALDRAKFNKRILFLVGLELVGMIQITVVEKFAGFACNNSSCDLAYTGYVNSRLILMVVVTVVRFGLEVFRFGGQKVLRINYIMGLNKFERKFSRILSEQKLIKFENLCEQQILTIFQVAIYCPAQPLAIIICFARAIGESTLMRFQLLNICKRVMNDRTVNSLKTSLQIAFYIHSFLVGYYLIVTLEQFEYVGFTLYLQLTGTPTLNSAHDLRMFIVFFVFVVFTIIYYVANISAQKSSPSSKRVHNKITQYLFKGAKGPSRTKEAAKGKQLFNLGRSV